MACAANDCAETYDSEDLAVPQTRDCMSRACVRCGGQKTGFLVAEVSPRASLVNTVMK